MYHLDDEESCSDIRKQHNHREGLVVYLTFDRNYTKTHSEGKKKL